MRNNEEIIDLMNNLREEKNISISELARRVDVAKSSLSRYFNKTREFPLNRTDDFAKALGVTSEYLLGIDFEKPKNMFFPDEIIKIPIIGTIAAGEPITAEQNIEEYVPFVASTVPNGKLIGLNIEGCSMSPGIPDGSRVLVRLQPDVEDDEIAAVLINGDTEATLKRIKRQNGMMMLIPDNKRYDPIIVTKDTPVKIIGKAVQVFYNL